MMAIGLGVGLPFLAGGGFAPSDLGASLYDAWDAERADLISLSGSAVTAWASTKNAYSAAQAVGAARPVYSATSFNGRPGITFDGSDDELTYAGVGLFPIGANACEMWVLASQDSLPADTTNRRAFAYGDTTSTARSVMRGVDTGVNRALGVIGNGAGDSRPSNASVDLSGRHVIRLIIGATSSQVDVDGAAGAPQAVVPATATGRVRLGALSATVASSFWQGALSFAAVTTSLSADQAAQMLAYLKARGGIA